MSIQYLFIRKTHSNIYLLFALLLLRYAPPLSIFSSVKNKRHSLICVFHRSGHCFLGAVDTAISVDRVCTAINPTVQPRAPHSEQLLHHLSSDKDTLRTQPLEDSCPKHRRRRDREASYWCCAFSLMVLWCGLTQPELH